MPKKLESSFHSRQYMLSKDYEIYYYNDRKFYNVQEHTHTYYEFYFFLEGNVQMYIDGKKYQMESGDVVLIPPQISHYAEVTNLEDTPYRRFVFWISQDYANQLIQQATEYGYLLQYVIHHKEYIFRQDLVTSNEIQSKVFRLLSEVNSKRFGRETQIQVCIQDLLLLLNRKVYESKNPVTQQESISLYQNLLLFIEEHLDEDLSLERLAGEFYVSKYYISHLFRENAGFPIHQYIMKKRLSLCKDAIMTNAGITDIFQQFGFVDYTSFYRAFRKEYGMSPSEYRKVNLRTEEVSGKRD